MPSSFCDLVDCSPPGFSVCAISQARILEWVAISFSRGSSWTRDRTHVSCISRQILYLWGLYMYICMCMCVCVDTHTPLFCLSGGGHLGFFSILAVVSSATVRMRVQLPFLFIYCFWLHWVFFAVCRLSLVGLRESGLLFVAVHGLLAATASLAVDTGSRYVGFSSCGPRV